MKMKVSQGSSLVHFGRCSSPQASRRWFITKYCSVRFHTLSLAAYFPFTSLPSVLVYTT